MNQSNPVPASNSGTDRTGASAPPSPPPQARVIQMLEQFWLARAVGAAASLRLADALAERPRSVAELAAATGTHEPSLRRLVRALIAYGVFRDEGAPGGGGGRVGLTDLGQTLVSGRPGSMRDFVATILGGEHYAAWGELEHSLRTGQTAFDHHYGADVWTYFREHPDRGEEFNRTMVAATAAVNDAVLQAYDFRPFKHIVDIGGGHGSLLRLALEQNPTARGTLFDQPNVIEEAKAQHAKDASSESSAASREPTAGGLRDRITFVGGSFFEGVPEGGDAYLLKYILHDWDDARCETILKNVRRAIAPGGTLLVFDTVVPPPDQPDFSMLMDLNMLAMTGGRERTEPELRDLLSRGGFAMKRVIRTQSHVSITEAAPA